jgi:uncharacterized circularly permuted ATP-grasp superfamily protein/uncharacterized alpha-E superfamily protein
MTAVDRQAGENERPERHPLVAGYRTVPGVHDEMMDAAGNIRPHWASFLAGLERMADGERQQSWETAQRLVRENGVTYNVYDDPQGLGRPWRLDPIPLLIGAEDWRALEKGVIQRARLLNALLGDLYGPQRALREGLLPSSLVFGNANFLRPLHGVEARDGVHLHLMAMDVGRAPDGRWWILSDRTQAPSGAGYALENRVVMGRSLPGLFREAQVQRLASFFQTFSDRLLELTRREQPLVVLMTPGPLNETYFEHAYLARYLGVPLVEGADLTVRDNRCYLKTLHGLQQVDLILRRMDSEYCDPLELKSDSALGVAGLVGAVRAGNVILANGLGSGLLECEALKSFMPGLCRAMLGEELLLPEIATWWCGQETERQYVMENLDKLVIAYTFGNRSIVNGVYSAMVGAQLTDASRAILVERMERRGYDYIGQELVSLSTTPVLRDGALQPGPMALRVYVAATADGYRLMPGGLTRTADTLDARAISMQHGDASKDTWILWDGPISTFSRLASGEHEIALRRSGSNIPSRVADNLFWLGRYAERAEATTRLFRSLLLRLAGEAGGGEDATTLERLTRILVDLGYLRSRTARKAAAGGVAAVERELWTLLFDPQCPSGLLILLNDLQRTETTVRDRLSRDASRLFDLLRNATQRRKESRSLQIGDALQFLNATIHALAAFSGMQTENMTRSIGWRLLDMGRRIERGSHMTKLLRELVVRGAPEEEGALDLLLELGDSFMTYRSRYLTTPRLAPTVDLLLTDDTNPRSVAFQLARLEEHVAHLPHDDLQATLTRDRSLVVGMRSDLMLADLHAICAARTGRGVRNRLDALLESQARRFAELSDAIARSYFSHADTVWRAATVSSVTVA